MFIVSFQIGFMTYNNDNVSSKVEETHTDPLSIENCNKMYNL